MADRAIWKYAIEHDAVIVTKVRALESESDWSRYDSHNGTAMLCYVTPFACPGISWEEHHAADGPT
jgi:hypothetical protein